MKWRIFALAALLCLAACGDDDSDFATRPDGKESSSSEASSSNISPKSSDSKTKNDGSEYDADNNTLTDFRDGQIYKTVTIGDQVWMAENLNYAYTDVPYKNTYRDTLYTSDSTSWCYGNDPANCFKYGRLYTWAAAMDSVGEWGTNGKGCGYNVTCTLTYPVRGICPEGWHLPDTTEWNTLFVAVGDQSTPCEILKSTSGWDDGGNGTDAYSFSALPAGNRGYSEDFYNAGYDASFWSSTEFLSYGAYLMSLYHYNDVNADVGSSDKYSGFSVRCLKD